MGERNVVDRPCVCDQAGFVDVGSSQQLPPGATLQVTVGGHAFTLVNLGGRLRAIGDLCLCCGRSLSTAAVDGGLLVCRGCGWTYDAQRGCVDGLPNLRIEMHEVHVEDGRLMLASAVTAPARL